MQKQPDGFGEDAEPIQDQPPKYVWEGRVIRLTYKDYNQWKRAYPYISIDGPLQAKDDELWQIGTEEQKQNWFFTTSMWLMAMNQTQERLTRAEQRIGKDRTDPNRNDPFATQYGKNGRYD